MLLRLFPASSLKMSPYKKDPRAGVLKDWGREGHILLLGCGLWERELSILFCSRPHPLPWSCQLPGEDGGKTVQPAFLTFLWTPPCTCVPCLGQPCHPHSASCPSCSWVPPLRSLLQGQVWFLLISVPSEAATRQVLEKFFQILCRNFLDFIYNF